MIPGLGKNTARLFLAQIDNMMSYPHPSPNVSEGLGELVDAFAGFQHNFQERQGGISNSGWKQKGRNVIVTINSPEKLNKPILHLLEEQHDILEICAGNLESILINAHIDPTQDAVMVAGSLAFCISRDTLHSYFSLLNHLAGVNNTVGWETCKE